MIVDDRRQRALAILDGFATADEPLAPHTTYKLGGPASVFATPRDIHELSTVGKAVGETGLPVLVIGRGSNLLIADSGFDGIVVSLSAMGESIEIDDVEVEAGGSAAMPVVARRTAAAGLVGFEWAVGVPGSIGGAVRMNAGGHGSDIAAVLVSALLIDLRTGRQGWVPGERLGLRMRGSDIADHQVVVAARLLLAHGDPVTAEATIAEIVRWRREHQPGGQNAGSVFVNPVPGEVAAGALIERLGLRGFSIGGAVVSEKHANFVQATEGATAADVRAVIEHVREVVHVATGYLLRSEVRLAGFADNADTADDDRPGVVI